MSDHPLDIDIYDLAEHLRDCQDCRRLFARVLYDTPKPEFEPWSDK